MIENVPNDGIIASSSVCNTLKMDRATSPIPGCSHFADQSTNISPKRDHNALEKEYLHKKLQDTKTSFSKKFKLLQQKIRRKESRIITLEAILNSLKKNNMLGTEELQILQDIGGSNSKILERQLLKNRGKPVNKQFDSRLRSFALTLHYYSPRAYEYVRQEFNNCLPHCKTISKWYQSIHGKPGIMLEAVNAIKQRSNSVDYQLFGSLVFDEMAIRNKLLIHQ